MDNSKKDLSANASGEKNEALSDAQKNAIDTLGGMPSYEEFRAGAKGDDTTSDTVISDTFLKFEETHPELGQEMRENNVPLNEADFKAGGYEFYKDSGDGQPHVKVKTEELKDWQKAHENEPPMWMRRFISMRDQSQRATETESEAKKEGGFEKKVGLWTAKEQVEATYRDLFPDRALYGRKKWRMLEEVPRIAMRDLDIRRQEMEKHSFATQTYKIAAKDALADSRTVVSQEAFNEKAFGRLNTERAYSVESLKYEYSPLGLSSRYYAYETPEVVQEILRKNQAEVLGGAAKKGFDGLSAEMKQDAEKTAAEELISSGGFMQAALMKNPEFADETLRRLGIDKSEDKTCFWAIGGYGYIEDEPARKAFGEFFKLEDRLAEMIEEPDGREYFTTNEHGEVCRRLGWTDEAGISEEISKKARQKIDKATSRLMEDISSAELFADIIEKNKRLMKEEETEKLVRVFSGNADDDGRSYSLSEDNFAKLLDEYLGKSVLKCSRLELPNLYINQRINDEKLGYLMDRRHIADKLGVNGVEIEMDYPATIRDALTERLRNGVGKIETHTEKWAGGFYRDYYGEDTAYLADIFKTEAFLDNQERMGLDFNDPTVKTAALEGLLNTLTKVRHNDERKFEQADWYMENFFAENPGEIRNKLKAYNESGLYDRWAKGQVTKFLEKNDLVAKYVREEEERRAEKKRNRIISGTILRSASPEDIRGLIRRRQEELITEIEKAGAEKITTFRVTEPGHHEQKNSEGATSYESLVPVNYGLEKVTALSRYYDFIDHNLPGAKPHYFVDTFPGEERISDTAENRFDGVKLNDEQSYVGFTFEYEGKLCVISESFNDDAGMFLYCGEPGGNFKEMFDNSKVAARLTNPNVARVVHFDRKNIGDSLDTAYKKAFMFFRTGDKRYMTYGEKPSDKAEWIKRQREEFPAWPLGIVATYKEHQEEVS